MTLENAQKEAAEKRHPEHHNKGNKKYMIQKRLLIESSDTKEETLSKKYVSTLGKMRDAVRSFAENAKLAKTHMLSQHMQLSNSIISRIYSKLHPKCSLPHHHPPAENLPPQVPQKPPL